uniref:Hedgehog protein Hint domain-containing protein n=1 Tax=Compsopogon caeruleus TaxID=31354 RepID=A0A7S1THN3_9RHOD
MGKSWSVVGVITVLCSVVLAQYPGNFEYYRSLDENRCPTTVQWTFLIPANATLTNGFYYSLPPSVLTVNGTSCTADSAEAIWVATTETLPQSLLNPPMSYTLDKIRNCQPVNNMFNAVFDGAQQFQPPQILNVNLANVTADLSCGPVSLPAGTVLLFFTVLEIRPPVPISIDYSFGEPVLGIFNESGVYSGGRLDGKAFSVGDFIPDGESSCGNGSDSKPYFRCKSPVVTGFTEPSPVEALDIYNSSGIFTGQQQSCAPYCPPGNYYKHTGILEPHSYIAVIEDVANCASFSLCMLTVMNDTATPWTLNGAPGQADPISTFPPSPSPFGSTTPTPAPTGSSTASSTSPTESGNPTPTNGSSTMPSTTPTVSGNPTPSTTTSLAASSDGNSTVSPSSSNGSVCFPADATVELESGELIPMRLLKIGDRVRDTPSSFSTVFGFTHASTSERWRFVRIVVGERFITLSAAHYLYVNGVLKSADQVVLGDIVEGSPVSTVESTEELGLFAPHTMSGDIMVNGIRASCYTRHVNPTWAHMALVPLRFASLTGLSSINSAISSAFAEVHQNSFLQSFRRTLVPSGTI